jgi:hypothetical protein
LNGSTRRAALLILSTGLRWRKPEVILLMSFTTPPLYLQIDEVLGVESHLRENCYAASQEISHVLWNPKHNRRVHTISPLLSALSVIHAVNTFLSCFLNIHWI